MEIGDKVKIKSKYHKDCDPYDYTAGFTKDMLINYGGKIATIQKKLSFGHFKPIRKIKDDGFFYCLNIDTCGWTWTSGMFEKEF